MRINSTGLVIGLSFLILTILITSNASAATVEVVTGKLPTQLHEGDQVDFTIKIKDYEGVGQLTLETDLIASADKPLWKFGESEEPIIDANRYQPKITLNLSSLPAILSVSVSGKVPGGIDTVKSGDIVLNKMRDAKLKFYEIRADRKLAGIDSFELIIKIKDEFEKTLQSIRRKEFDNMKTDVRKVFDDGLTTEAQNIATDMNNIKWPDNIILLGGIKIENDMMINIIFIVSILLCFVVGYVIGIKRIDDDEND